MRRLRGVGDGYGGLSPAVLPRCASGPPRRLRRARGGGDPLRRRGARCLLPSLAGARDRRCPRPRTTRRRPRLVGRGHDRTINALAGRGLDAVWRHDAGTGPSCQRRYPPSALYAAIFPGAKPMSDGSLAHGVPPRGVPPGAGDILTLLVGNQALTGWQRVTVTRPLAAIPSSFDIEVTERYP